MPKFCQTDASEALSLHHEILAPQDEAVAQVLLAHHLVLRQLLGRALEEDFPLEQEVGAVGDAERLLHVVVGDEDADVLVLQFPDDLLTPAKGSSSMMNLGSMARQRAISVRRRSPPDSWLPLFLRTFWMRNSVSRLSSFSLR